MPSKPETSYIKLINDELARLAPEIYFEKTHNEYRGGTFDVYYEAAINNVMWVEYKWYDSLAPVVDLLVPIKRPKMTPLQQEWGKRAKQNALTALVVIGFKPKASRFSRGVILRDWTRSLPRDEVFRRSLDKTAMAEALINLLYGEDCAKIPVFD